MIRFLNMSRLVLKWIHDEISWKCLKFEEWHTIIPRQSYSLDRFDERAVKNKHNDGLKNLNFEFLVNLTWKKMSILLFWIFLFNTKKFPWFPYLKTSFPLIFCRTMVELCSFITSCFWGPAHWMYWKHQLSKFFLNFG